MIRALCLLCLLCLLAATAPAVAGDLTVTVRTGAGDPVVNAVVSVPGEFGPDGPPTAVDYQMAQENLQFDPFVLTVPLGADVLFPNRDRVRHHVYSFASGNRFELELYGREQERSVRFEQAGNVPVGCNIHDDMIAFIRVVDTPHAATTGADGRAVLGGVPQTAQTLTVWHPYGNAQDNRVTLDIEAGATSAEITLDLLDRR